MTNEVSLPAALVMSDNYQALNACQQASILARLHHCAEIAGSGLNAVSGPESALLDAIDDIELDALSIMGTSGDTAKSVAPYRVHSSWTFACDREVMARQVGDAEARFLQEARLRFDASHAETRAWLRSWASALQSALERFSTSSSFCESVAQLIVVDAIVSAYLVFSAMVRLNAQLS